jgi:hypothetical protein
MKKIIVYMLVLGLAVPAQAWHLFPVREKIVTVKETKTNYAVCAITGVVVGAICIVIGYKLKGLKTSIDVSKIENRTINRVNLKLNPFALIFDHDSIRGICVDEGYKRRFGVESEMFDIEEPASIRRAVESQHVDLC